MAAAIVPLIAGLAPEIVQGITAIVQLVHKHAPVAQAQIPSSGSTVDASGQLKFAQVFSDVMMALQQAAAVGTIPKALPPDETIKAVIQAVVTSMKITGALGGMAAASTAPGNIVLGTGQSVTISVR